MATLNPGVTEFVDGRITAGQVYQYRAMAVAGGMIEQGDLSIQATRQITESSEYSPIVQVQAMRAVPGAPGTPVVTPLSSSELHLSWTLPLSAPISTRILRLDPGQALFEEVALVPGGVTAFVDVELISGTTYAYQLQAVDEAGDSVVSDTGYGTTWGRSLPAPS